MLEGQHEDRCGWTRVSEGGDGGGKDGEGTGRIMQGLGGLREDSVILERAEILCCRKNKAGSSACTRNPFRS